jgi:dynein heavy chain
LFELLKENRPPEEYKQWIEQPARKVSAPLPDGKSVYDIMFSKFEGKWGLWLDLVDDTPPPPDSNFEKIIVPTADFARYTFLMDIFIHHHWPLLLVGPTGTGKSVYVQQYLMKLDAEL